MQCCCQGTIKINPATILRVMTLSVYVLLCLLMSRLEVGYIESMNTFIISCWVHSSTMMCTNTSDSPIISSRTKCQIDANDVPECEYYTIIEVCISVRLVI